MDQKTLLKLLAEQLPILDSATQVLRESHERVGKILSGNAPVLSIAERESCEALTARFARLCDFLFQRAFRTIDQIELQDEGTAIDRLNRMEKRGVIESATRWRSFRELRNEIAHEYLIEQSDRVLSESYKQAVELFKTVDAYKKYIFDKGYVSIQ